MSHEMISKIFKLWKSGNYSSKRELYNGVLDYYGIIESTAQEGTLWIIKYACDKAVQGASQIYMFEKENAPYRARKKKK